MMLDEDTKRIITDACSEGRFDDAVAILTAAITRSAFVFHSNFINDISRIDVQTVPAAMRFAESASSNRYLQAESGADLPALLLNARSVKLSIAGCIIGPNCVRISVNSEGDVIVAIQNARIEDGLTAPFQDPFRDRCRDGGCEYERGHSGKCSDDRSHP
jgi:hypothetical protein